MTEDPALEALMEWVELTLEQISQQIRHEATKETHDAIH